MRRRRGIEPRGAAFSRHGARLFAAVGNAVPHRWPIVAVLALAACSATPDRGGQDGLSDSEARQLNDAAAMLDRNSVSADVLPNNVTEPNP